MLLAACLPKSWNYQQSFQPKCSTVKLCEQSFIPKTKTRSVMIPPLMTEPMCDGESEFTNLGFVPDGGGRLWILERSMVAFQRCHAIEQNFSIANSKLVRVLKISYNYWITTSYINEDEYSLPDDPVPEVFHWKWNVFPHAGLQHNSGCWAWWLQKLRIRCGRKGKTDVQLRGGHASDLHVMSCTVRGGISISFFLQSVDGMMIILRSTFGGWAIRAHQQPT